MSASIRYAFDDHPAPGETREVAPGIHWLRMPLPFKLDHINLWLLDDGDGWTIVDTGINRDEVRAAWEAIFAVRLAEKPVRRVLVTHFHPDHMGLAGWLTERFGVELWAPLGEWAFARMISLDIGDAERAAYERFYAAAGFDAGMLALVADRLGAYASRVSPIPRAFRRIRDGDAIEIGGRTWRVMVGTGHSPEHACLVCEDARVMIAGDQVLPRISPNISVWPQEPESDPLSLYFASLPRFRVVPDDVLVLPSHDGPFEGLHARLDGLLHHHDARLVETLAACAEPRTGVDVLRSLFKRELDAHQVFFAIGESLAHLHYLMGQGKIARTADPDGAFRFQTTAEARAA